ncbi:DUF6602 domain-containing protein [Methylorubrum podarium]|uniref:DUF6602 domain-containing protein n=1 Tax=Methylorubrum podarium TaxID=200476 RepID=A0ABV1QGQ9_9HYPH
MDFKELFNQQQKILELELEVARTRFEHSGLRGNALEIASRDFFEKHLPRSVNVGTGEVIASESDSDSVGARSGQMDLVFSNQSQPFSTARDVPTLFFIEGVLAAGEVKTSLSRSIMPDELRKARKFRALRAKNMSRLVQVTSPNDWASYYVFYRPYFMVATETKSPWQSILLEVMEYIDSEKILPLDGIFLLDQNVALILSPHQKAPFTQQIGLPFTHKVGALDATGFIMPYSTDTPLAFLMGWLSLFRTSFFEDQQPISLYLQNMVNSSLREMTLFKKHTPVAELTRAIEKKGLWRFNLDELRQEYPKRQKP